MGTCQANNVQWYQGKCPVFSRKFKATGSVTGILEALDMSFKNKFPAENDTLLVALDANKKAQIEAKVKNTMVINYTYLIMGILTYLAYGVHCHITYVMVPARLRMGLHFSQPCRSW